MHSGGGKREKMSALIIYILRRSSRFYLPAVHIHGRVTPLGKSGRCTEELGVTCVASCRFANGAAGLLPITSVNARDLMTAPPYIPFWPSCPRWIYTRPSVRI